jgi:nuclear GTP-binding protein
VEYPAQYIEAVLKRVQPRHLQRTYDIKEKDYDNDAVRFLEILCRKSGRLLKGGEADIDGAAKQVLNDWIRGKIPWFTPPPYKEGAESGPVNERREGKLGEMSKKRKRGTESEATASVAATTDVTGTSQDEADKDEDDEFGGFSDDEDLQLDAEDDEEDEEETSDDDEEGGTLLESVADDDVSENDDEIEEEVAAISQALSKAKKRQRT